MAKDTFNSYIQKNQNKFANRHEQAQKQQDDIAQLSSILDEMAVDSMKYETGSYSKKEVAEAAKSLLRAQPYDVDITHMDLSDNAVYYSSETKKSRGRFARKNVRDYGNMMIKRAKEIRDERKEFQKKKEERADFVNSSLKDMTLSTEDITIKGDWKRETGYAEKEAGFYSTDMFSKFTKISGYSEKLQGTFQGEMGEAVQEKIKTTLSGDIPPYEEVVKKLNDKMQRSFENYGQNLDRTEKDLADQKASLMKEYSDNLKLIERRYRDVQEGRVSPEAFKLFMDTTLFTFRDESQRDLYNTFVSDENTSSEKTEDKEKTEEKKKILNDLETEYDKKFKEEEKNYYEKGIQRTGEWRKKLFKNHPYKGAVDKIAQMYKDIMSQATTTNISKNKAFLESNFVHFTGNKAHHKKIKKRYYVTCNKDKHAELLEAWAAVLERNKDLSQRIKFKFGGDIMQGRKDNIVIYVPEGVEEKDMMTLMKGLSDECKDKKILAEDKDSMQTAGKVLDDTGKVLDGITIAPEFPVNGVVKTIINNGLNDTQKTKEFLEKVKGIAKKENKTTNIEGDRPEYKFSYNGYLSKAAFLAHSIVRQKHNIKPEDSIDGNEELMKEATTYFNDFIRLSGVDPATFEHLS